MAKSLLNRIKKKRDNAFVGRNRYVDSFSNNLDSDDPVIIFNIYGQGGVGKSYLSRKYINIAEENGCLTTYTDESIKSLLDWMGAVANQLKSKGTALAAFEATYETYLTEVRKLEIDPDKPKGKVVGLAKTSGANQLTVNVQGQEEGQIASDLAKADEASATADEWGDFVRKKIADKQVIELILNPVDSLSPLFWKGINKCADTTHFICFFLDTFEQTDVYLEPWLQDVLNGKHGDEIPENIIIVIAGREKLEANKWSDFSDFLQMIPLEPFTDKEGREYLIANKITDKAVQNDIIHLSGGLPVLMAWLVETARFNPSNLQDVCETAVERFLKWIKDEKKKKIALYLSTTRFFNQEILSLLLTNTSEAKPLFEWILSQPFVLKKGNIWTYHQVVRDQMLRYLRTRSTQKWKQIHSVFSTAFAQWQADLIIPDNERLTNETWTRFEQERIYHILGSNPDQILPYALNELIQIWYYKGIDKSKQWAQTLYEAGLDNEHLVLKNWGYNAHLCSDAIHNEAHTHTLQSFIEDILQKAYITENTYLAYLHFMVGAIYNNQKAYHKAIVSYQKTTNLRANDYDAYNNIGLAYYNLGDNKKAHEFYQKAIDINPDFYISYYNIGLIYYNTAQYDKAIENYQKAMTINPDYSNVIYNLALAYVAKKDYDQAISCLNKPTFINQNKKEAYYNIGLIYNEKKDFDLGAEYFQKAIDADPEYVNALNNLGLYHYNKNAYDQAEALFKKALEIAPDYYNAINNLGLILFNQNELEKAKSHFEKALKIQPNFHQAARNLGLVHLSLKKPKKAIEWYQKTLKIIPDDYATFNDIGVAYRDLKDDDNAIKYYKKALKIEPTFITTLNNLGLIYYDKKDWDQSLIFFNKVLALDTTSPDTYYNIGNIYRFKNDYEKALLSYEKVIQIDPKYAKAFFHIGYISGEQGKYKKALKNYEKVLLLTPNDHEALNNIGWINEQQNQPESAIAYYQKSIDAKPDYTLPMVNIGLIHYRAENYQEAIAYYEMALEVDAQCQDALMELGRTYQVIKDMDQSIEYLQKLLLLRPNDQLALSNIAYDYFGKGDYPKSIEYYKKAVAIPPAQNVDFFNLGLASEKIGDNDQAIKYYQEALRIQSDDILSLNNLSRVYEVTDDFKKAIKYAKKALQVDSKNFDALFNMGYIYDRSGAPKKALNAYQKALKIQPDDINTNINLGFLSLQANDLEEAEARFKHGIQLGSANYGNMNLGHIRLIKQDQKEAITYYKKSLEAFDNQEEFWAGMEEDFQYLEQYGINKKSYQKVMDEIKASQKDV